MVFMEKHWELGHFWLLLVRNHHFPLQINYVCINQASLIIFLIYQICRLFQSYYDHEGFYVVINDKMLSYWSILDWDNWPKGLFRQGNLTQWIWYRTLYTIFQLYCLPGRSFTQIIKKIIIFCMCSWVSGSW